MEIGNVGLSNWDDKPVYIVGGGPSLKPFQKKLALLYQLGHVIAVNDAYKHCKYPDVIFTLDHQWLENRFTEIPSMQSPVFAAVEFENHPCIDCENLTYLWRYPRWKATLSEDKSQITNGHNSGYGALNFAYLKGAKTIFLLGFDFKLVDEKKHFHEGYKWTSPQDPNNVFPMWAKLFDDTLPQFEKAGVKVFNCSNNSAMTAFPYKAYEDVL